MSTEISTDMVQRPSNPQSATQGEVAKRGSISGRLLQTVPEKGNCSDTKKKEKLKGMYAWSTFSRNYLFLCQQLSHVYGSKESTEWSKKPYMALPTAFCSNVNRNKASPQMVKGELL